MSTRSVSLLCAVLLGTAALSCVSASAHHSFAMFDQGKQVTIRGTVKEFQWTNPHIWVQLMVPDKNGKLVEWSIEGGSINMLARQGWRAKTLKPGDQITMRINPLRNGKPGGSILDIVLPNGKTMWGNPTGTPPSKP